MSDADRKARRAKWLLGAGVLMALVATWSSWDQLQLIQSVARGTLVSDAALEDSDTRQAVVGFVQLGLGIAVAIVFLMWTSALTRRLIELGVADLRYAPKWSVWGFIVPILNLFRPHQVMSELWRASEIAPGPDDPWRAKPTPTIVHLWWGVLLIDSVVGRVLLQSGRTLDTIEQITQYATITVASDALGILSAGLAFQLVSVIDTRLRGSEDRLAGLLPTPVSAPTV